MGSATDWERDNEATLNAIKEAMANSDPYLAGEILERLAPHPVGENVRVKEKALASLASREVEVIDPRTGQLDNPDGPAVIKSNGTRRWYTAGMLHNESGPAILRLSGEVEYYYLGTKCQNAQELDTIVEKAKKHAVKTTHVRSTPQNGSTPSV
ncbi:MAG: hypothetical protein NUV50_05310 [Rhodospirillales bacterium]|nr:hypothetical protein [Rhodospirillales bacterium]